MNFYYSTILLSIYGLTRCTLNQNKYFDLNRKKVMCHTKKTKSNHGLPKVSRQLILGFVLAMCLGLCIILLFLATTLR